MRKVDVEIQAPVAGNKRIWLYVQGDDDTTTGRIEMGKATVSWHPKRSRKARGRKSWEQVIDFLCS